MILVLHLVSVVCPLCDVMAVSKDQSILEGSSLILVVVLFATGWRESCSSFFYRFACFAVLNVLLKV